MTQLSDLPTEHTWTINTTMRQQSLMLVVALQLVLCVFFGAWLLSDSHSTEAAQAQVVAACGAGK